MANTLTKDLKRVRKTMRSLTEAYARDMAELGWAGNELGARKLTDKQKVIYNEIDVGAVAAYHLPHNHACSAHDCIVSGRGHEIPVDHEAHDCCINGCVDVDGLCPGCGEPQDD